jgi:hypothetical protein
MVGFAAGAEDWHLFISGKIWPPERRSKYEVPSKTIYGVFLPAIGALKLVYKERLKETTHVYFAIGIYSHGITWVISPKKRTHFVDVSVMARPTASKTSPAKKGGSDLVVNFLALVRITSQHKIIRC